MEQFSDLAEIFSLEEVVVLVLQVLDECGLLVDGLVLVVDGFEEDVVVLGEGLDPVLELLLREREQQLVHVVHTVLQVRHRYHEPVPRGEQIDS